MIEALRYRIDVIVQALAFNPRFLEDLLTRIEENRRPEEAVPREIVFSAAEIDRMEQVIRAVTLPAPVRRRIEFFASQFEFFDAAADQFEYKTKDTARLAGIEWHLLSSSAFLLMIVPLIVFFSLQRYFVQGLLAGSVKS